MGWGAGKKRKSTTLLRSIRELSSKEEKQDTYKQLQGLTIMWMLRAGSLGSCFLHGHPAPLHINAWLSQMASFPSLRVLICKVGNTMSRGMLSGFSEMLNTSGWNRAKTSCQLLFKQIHRCFPGRVKTWSCPAWPQLSLQFLRLSREIPHLQHQCIPALNSATVVPKGTHMHKYTHGRAQRFTF